MTPWWQWVAVAGVAVCVGGCLFWTVRLSVEVLRAMRSMRQKRERAQRMFDELREGIRRGDPWRKRQ